MITREEKLLFFMNMLHSCCDVGVWAFSEEGELYYSSSIHEKELELLFCSGPCMEYALDEGKKINGPFEMCDALGMVWQGEFVELRSKKQMLVLLGPVFYNSVTQKKLENSLRSLNLSVQFGNICKRILMELPVVAMNVFEQYGQMMHCAIAGEESSARIQLKSLPYENSREEGMPSDLPEDTYERKYQLEQLLLKCIEEGNRNYMDVFRRMGGAGIERFVGDNPHLEALITMAMFAAQCSAAAIKGGVPVKAAKQMEREYVLRAQETANLVELKSLNQLMLDDWIEKVNEYRTDYGVSAPIRDCCNYIKEHLTDKLEIGELSKQFGYTHYYLTRKFKNEMGMKISDYIKEKRIEYAKVWLLTSDKSIQEIAELLDFSDRSYFSRVFKSVIGVAPETYREQSKKYIKGVETFETEKRC